MNTPHTPARVQLRRTKGWRMPPQCVKVARPSQWGNPWEVVQNPETGSWYAKRKGRPFVPRRWLYYRGAAVMRAVELFARYARFRSAIDPDWISSLRGKSLACFCKLSDPCHADVLLELANKTTEPTTEGDALWASIGEMPECQLRRGVAADWFEERSGTVECPNCAPPRAFPPYAWKCPTCKGEQYIPDRNGRLAAALRATADRVPFLSVGDLWCFSGHAEPVEPDELAWGVRMAMSDARRGVVGFPTAAAAIRDLCEAWCKVTYGEVGE